MRKLLSGLNKRSKKKDSKKEPEIEESGKSPSTPLAKSRAASSNLANITKDFSGPEIRPSGKNEYKSFALVTITNIEI